VLFVIQLYFQCSLLLINNFVLLNSNFPPFSTYTHVRSSGESFTNYLSLLWSALQQATTVFFHILSFHSSQTFVSMLFTCDKEVSLN